MKINSSFTEFLNPFHNIGEMIQNIKQGQWLQAIKEYGESIPGMVTVRAAFKYATPTLAKASGTFASVLTKDAGFGPPIARLVTRASGTIQKAITAYISPASRVASASTQATKSLVKSAGGKLVASKTLLPVLGKAALAIGAGLALEHFSQEVFPKWDSKQLSMIELFQAYRGKGESDDLALAKSWRPHIFTSSTVYLASIPLKIKHKGGK